MLRGERKEEGIGRRIRAEAVREDEGFRIQGGNPDPRQRKRDPARDTGQNIRAVFHDEAHREGDGPRTFVKLRYCREAAPRRDKGGLEARRVHRIHHSPSQVTSSREGKKNGESREALSI